MTSEESPRNPDLDRMVVAHVNRQWARLVFHVPPGVFEYAAQDEGVVIDLTDHAQLIVTTPTGTLWVLDDGVFRLTEVDEGLAMVGFADGLQVSSVIVPRQSDG